MVDKTTISRQKIIMGMSKSGARQSRQVALQLQFLSEFRQAEKEIYELKKTLWKMELNLKKLEVRLL